MWAWALCMLAAYMICYPKPQGNGYFGVCSLHLSMNFVSHSLNPALLFGGLFIHCSAESCPTSYSLCCDGRKRGIPTHCLLLPLLKQLTELLYCVLEGIKHMSGGLCLSCSVAWCYSEAGFQHGWHMLMSFESLFFNIAKTSRPFKWKEEMSLIRRDGKYKKQSLDGNRRDCLQLS